MGAEGNPNIAVHFSYFFFLNRTPTAGILGAGFRLDS